MTEKAALLPHFSVTRPITVIMGFIALLVVGYIAYSQIPVELFPSGYQNPWMGVWVPYRDTNPWEVEDRIAKPVEETLRTVRGIKNMRSNSRTSGCWISMSFQSDTDMSVAYLQVRDRLDRVMPELPDDVNRTYIRKWSEEDSPIIWAAIAMEQKPDDAYYLVESNVKLPLERIDGVANVQIWGADEKYIQIELHQDRIKAHRVNIYALIQQLQQDNFSLASGYVRDNGQKVYVRSLAKYETLEEVENIPLRSASASFPGAGTSLPPPVSSLKLKDIATIRYDTGEHRQHQEVDGKPTVMIGVFRESGANIVTVTEEVRKKWDEEISKRPGMNGMDIQILFDQGALIKDSIDNLKTTGLWGGLFAVIVLFFFLRRVRVTLIITLAIPISLLITMTFLYFIGWSLNMMTMMGMMVGVGMVVDNSIVVVENIFRMKQSGASSRAAAITGASEVSLAVTMATLTTAVVFLPLILMNDDAGFRFFMLRIGLPVVVALVGSLLVALIFIPLGASRIISEASRGFSGNTGGEVQSTSEAKKRKSDSLIDKTNRLYQRVLRWTLTHRMDAALIAVVILWSMTFAQGKVQKTDQGQGNLNDFWISYDMPDYYDQEKTKEILDQARAFLDTNREKYHIRTIEAGYHRGGSGRLRVFLHPPEEDAWWYMVYGQLKSWLVPSAPRRMLLKDVVEDVKKNGPEFVGVRRRINWEGGGGDQGSVSITLHGEDTATLLVLSEEVERRLRAIPDLIDVDTEMERGDDEIRLQMDREQTRKYGVSSQVIAGTISYALREIELPRFRTPEKEIPVRAFLKKEDRETLQQLESMTFRSVSGKDIPLGALVKPTIHKGFGRIYREDGKTVLRVTAVTTRDDLKELSQKIDQAMNGFEMPRGYQWSKTGRFATMEESGGTMAFALIMSITFVFLLMGVLFESFILPLCVLLTIPFAFFGVYWTLYLTNTTQDIMSMIGIIILIGIVVNNAIVLVDLVNRLRKEGYSRTDALMEAGKHRFRPILMTSFTTVFGLLPMALGNASLIGMPYAPMGRTMMGGLLASTVMTLVIVPLFYTFLDDLREWWKRLILAAFGARGAKRMAATEVT
ncbi:MAG: efflux RND transporter permease subunit [Candidatus Latescibacterota bacterium]